MEECLEEELHEKTEALAVTGVMAAGVRIEGKETRMLLVTYKLQQLHQGYGRGSS
jgi:hypothetical protein